MRVIARRTLREFWEKHADAEQPLRAWFHEAKVADWGTFKEIKIRYQTAVLIPGNRVIFYF
jgi:mRNA interferase HigB